MFCIQLSRDDGHRQRINAQSAKAKIIKLYGLKMLSGVYKINDFRQ